MSTTAFAASAAPAGAFTTPKLGATSFVNGLSPAAAPAAAKKGQVTMAVDAFQKKFQSFGKINVDYSRPKKLSSYKRSGTSGAMIGYPDSPQMAGHYSISNCNMQSGSAAILQKYDEYCAKGMYLTYKKAGTSFGVYNRNCTEATTPYEQAESKRSFNRTTAFKQAQKPVNVRLNEEYTARKHAIVMSHGCHAEESKFKSMPMSCAVFLQGNAEAEGACFRSVLPTSTAEDYCASGIRAQIIAQKMPGGVYPISTYCADGYKKGDPEDRRVAALSAEFRAQSASAFTVTHSAYAAKHMATKLYAHGCGHEETQFNQWPAVAAAMVRY